MKNLLFLALALPLFSCTTEVEADSNESTTPVTAISDMAVEAGTHAVKCGCVIETISQCGNYIEIDTQFVEIGNPGELGLGEDGMAFCKSGGGMAEAAGEIKDGKFIGSTLVVKN